LVVQTTKDHSPEARDRALGKLHWLTASVAGIALAATGVFAAVAAITIPGSSSASADSAVASTSSSLSAVDDASSSSSAVSGGSH
jgi:hypothetical protein